MNQTCMNCKHYKVEDAQSGYCRAQDGAVSNKEESNFLVRHDHACTTWADCGQHYYIRLGWIRAQEKKKAGC